MPHSSLFFDPARALPSGNAALFISRGDGIHPDRTITGHELIVVRTGVLGIQEADTRFAVAAGHYLLLFPGRRHRGTIPYDRDLSFYWIHFDLPPGGSRSLQIPQSGPVARPERCAELFQRFIEDRSDGTYPPSCNLLMSLLLCETAMARADTRLDGQPAALARQAQDYITAHHREAIGAARIAHALGCNADYLGRVFRLVQGRTLTAAIHRQRIAIAKQLLQQDSRSVADVAWTCGYRDGSYFAMLFKRWSGVTPLEYRRMYQR